VEPAKGACKLLISINGVLATVGIWQPPGGIVMTPNDAVVLGTALIPPLIVTD
jgi:hypothetical protein